jgi:hypothetical protein
MDPSVKIQLNGNIYTMCLVTRRQPIQLKNKPKLIIYLRVFRQVFRQFFRSLPNDEVRNKKTTTLTLSKAAQAGSCAGTQEREFEAKYEIINKTYFITYTKKPWLGDREGGVHIYGAPQSGLRTSNIAGTVPTNCATNLAFLKTTLGDTTSELTITSCTQNADTKANQTKNSPMLSIFLLTCQSALHALPHSRV